MELFAALSVVACSGSATGPEQTLCETARALRSTPTFLSVAEEADITARVLPGGFGGLFQELRPTSDGVLVAYLKEPASAGLKTALRTLLFCGAVYPGWGGILVSTELSSIALRQGDFTGTELLSYWRALEPLKSDPVVWGLEVDPETNRVWLGITGVSHLTRIRQAVADRGVPTAAVSIEAPAPTTGLEQFEVLDSEIATRNAGEFGSIYVPLRVRFTNRQNSTRYPDWCVNREGAFFLHTIEKWDGTTWKTVGGVACIAILLPPRAIAPGESVTDSVPVAGARRLNTIPPWLTARITGTYRFVGMVYTSTTPNPLGGTPFVSDLAPPGEQISTPFRLINNLPF